MSDELIFLDVASKMGCADGIIGKSPRLYTVSLSREADGFFTGPARGARWAAERLYVSRPRAVYIEAPPQVGAMHGHTNAKTITDLIGLVKAIGAIFENAGIPTHTAHVGTVRKWFLGAGNMKGDVAKRDAARIARALGWAPNNLDEADAAAGWHWACGLHGGFEQPKHLWISRSAA